MRDVSVYSLEVFLAVVAEKSVSRAAERMCISQPAVSSHLRGLEESLGGKLCQRTSQGMLPTPLGDWVSGRAERILALVAELRERDSNVGQELTGSVHLVASSTPGTYRVPYLISRFQQQYPRVEVELSVRNSRRTLEAVRTGRASLGIVGEYPRPGVSWDAGQSDWLRLVAASSHPLLAAPQIGPEQVRDQVLLLREVGSSSRVQAESLLGQLLDSFRKVREPGSSEALKEAVIANLGLAVLSSWVTAREEAAGLLQPFRDPLLARRRQFYLVRRRELGGAGLALYHYLRSVGVQ